MTDDRTDADYWRALNPDYPVSDDPWPKDAADFEYTARGDEADHICKYGFTRLDNVVPVDRLKRLTGLIMRLKFSGHTATDALLYDEVYSIFGGLGQALATILGPEILFLPDEFDCHFVSPGDEERGARPHRDSLVTDGPLFTDDGLPTVVNIWLALTDATADNGCIHAIPALRDHAFSDPSRDGEKRSFGFQDVQALPIPAGSMLCWSPRLIHWGGRSSLRAKTPRISIACYYQNASIPPLHPTTMPIGTPISFQQRRYLAMKVHEDPDGTRVHEFF